MYNCLLLFYLFSMSEASLIAITVFLIAHFLPMFFLMALPFPLHFPCQTRTVQKSAKSANPGLRWRWNGRSSVLKPHLHSLALLMTALEGAPHFTSNMMIVFINSEGMELDKKASARRPQSSICLKGTLILKRIFNMIKYIAKFPLHPG